MQTMLSLLAVWFVLAITGGVVLGKMIFLNNPDTEWPPHVRESGPTHRPEPEPLLEADRTYGLGGVLRSQEVAR